MWNFEIKLGVHRYAYQKIQNSLKHITDPNERITHFFSLFSKKNLGWGLRTGLFFYAFPKGSTKKKVLLLMAGPLRETVGKKVP